MRLCFYCPPLLGTGGMETVLALMINGLSDRGHECHLVISHQIENANKAWLNKFNNCHITNTSYIAKQDDIVYEILAFQQFLQENFPLHVIIALNSRGTAVARLATGLQKQRPLIVSQVHFSLEKISVNYLPLADVHLAISTGLAAQLRQTVSNPVFLLPNPIEDSAGFIVERPEIMTFAYVGRISNIQKRLDVIFHALAEFTEEEWSLKIVGDDVSDPYRQDGEMLKRLAEELQIDTRIEWLGYHNNPWKVLGQASVLLLTSDYEGFGLVLAEALARGLPVISSDCPEGPRDIIEHGVNGWLYETGNIQALISLLQNLWNGEVSFPDPQICVASVKKFSKESIIQKLEYILLQHCNASKYGEGIHNALSKKREVVADMERGI